MCTNSVVVYAMDELSKKYMDDLEREVLEELHLMNPEKYKAPRKKKGFKGHLRCFLSYWKPMIILCLYLIYVAGMMITCNISYRKEEVCNHMCCSLCVDGYLVPGMFIAFIILGLCFYEGVIYCLSYFWDIENFDLRDWAEELAEKLEERQLLRLLEDAARKLRNEQEIDDDDDYPEIPPILLARPNRMAWERYY